MISRAGGLRLEIQPIAAGFLVVLCLLREKPGLNS